MSEEELDFIETAHRVAVSVINTEIIYEDGFYHCETPDGTELVFAEVEHIIARGRDIWPDGYGGCVFDISRIRDLASAALFDSLNYK